jgi:predicted RNase H-like HicB family nuclease
MIHEYLNAALHSAQYKKLEDESWFAEVPGLDGVWANGESVEFCRQELLEVIEEWLILKLRDNDDIPPINNTTIQIPREEVA